MADEYEDYLATRKRMLDDMKSQLVELMEARKLDKDAAGQVTGDMGKGMLRAILEYLPEGMIVASYPDLRISLVSRYGRKLLGREFEDSTGRSLLDIMRAWKMVRDDRVTEAELEELPLTRAMKAGELVTEEEWILERSSGGRIPVLCNASPILNDEGRVTGGILSWVDIAELKQTQSRLRKSEEQLRATFEQAAVGIAHTTPDGRFLRVNTKYSDMLGYTHEELSKLSVYEVIHPEDMEGERRLTKQLLEGSIPMFTTERRCLRKDGSVIWTNVTGSLVRKGTGEPDYVVTVKVDVSERKQAEEALHRREREYRALVDNSPDLIARFDLDLRYIYVNPAVETIHQTTADRLIGLSIHDTDNSSGLIDQAARIFGRVISTGRAETYEYEYDLYGGRRAFQARVVPELDEDGKVTTLLTVSRDITNLKRMEARLREAKEEAEKASRFKGEFLANMSHEIRTPLNGIMGMAELALLSCTGGGCSDYLKMIRQSGDTLLGIINDILDLSKIEAGRMELEEITFSLEHLLDELVTTLGVHAGTKGISIDFRIEPGVPDSLEGDLGRLRQVLTNLIGNAVKFTESGSINIGVSLAERDDRSGLARIMFTVRDSGIGIPKDKLKTIFQSFSQVGTSAHFKYGGTGLGLAISKELVELMGGRIWADSELGRGSTFSFTVALRMPTGMKAEVQTRHEEVAAEVPPLKVLLAEDNPINRILAVELLGMRGHAVTAVENGREAVAALENERFDVVLMDVRMPDMDGEEAIRVIKASPPPGVDPSVPVIALTAHALAGDRERFMDEGFDAYVAKPIDMEELDRVLEKVLAKRKSG